MKIIVIIILVLNGALAYSQTDSEIIPELVTSKGQKLIDATISKVEPDGISFFHSTGGAKIKFEDLPQEWKTKYNFSPEKAAEYAAEQKTKRAQADHQIAQAIALQELEKKLEKTALDAEGNVFQVLEDGILAKGYYLKDYIVKREQWAEANTLWNRTTDPRSKKEMELRQWNEKATAKIPLGTDSDGLVFIHCNTDGLADNQSFSSILFRIGTYSYSNTMGARKTVPKFTTSKQYAIKYYLSN